MAEESQYAVVARQDGRDVVVMLVASESEGHEIAAGMRPAAGARIVRYQPPTAEDAPAR